MQRLLGTYAHSAYRNRLRAHSESSHKQDKHIPQKWVDLFLGYVFFQTITWALAFCCLHQLSRTPLLARCCLSAKPTFPSAMPPSPTGHTAITITQRTARARPGHHLLHHLPLELPQHRPRCCSSLMPNSLLLDIKWFLNVMNPAL